LHGSASFDFIIEEGTGPEGEAETYRGWGPSLEIVRLNGMKPLHIVLLVAAGAIGGALIMKVVQKPRTAEPVGVVSQIQTPPATAPATPPAAPADGQAASAPANPSPLESPKPVREAPPQRVHRAAANHRQAGVAAAIKPAAPVTRTCGARDC
jgi:hypothetical protein